MGKRIDLTGQRFGRLTVIERAGKDKKRVAWSCRCDCGKEVIVRADVLRGGGTKSCGCLHVDSLKKVVRIHDLTGQKFGRLTVIEYAGRDNQRLSLWKCRCECGNIAVTRASSLRNGTTQSCGCLRLENAKIACTTHGLSGGREKISRLYKIWCNMKSRCNNPNAEKYEIYGGRGISVCDEWTEYEPFHDWAMANGYSDELTIDRKNSDGNYEPENCRWATRQEQARNTRKNHLITYNGETKTLVEWADQVGLKHSALRCRLNMYGWTIEEALTLPKNTKVRYVRGVS